MKGFSGSMGTLQIALRHIFWNPSTFHTLSLIWRKTGRSEGNFQLNTIFHRSNMLVLTGCKPIYQNFCQMFQGLCSFKGVRLFWTLE